MDSFRNLEASRPAFIRRICTNLPYPECFNHLKARFVEHTGAASLWPIKQQHDTLMQCFANSVTLAGPVLLMATNQKSKELHWLEIAGCVGWVCSFALENMADLQKISFVADAHKKGDLRTAVLGHAPYDGSRYWLWRMCRHPNYFGEVRARGRRGRRGRRRCARLCAVEIMVVCNVWWM